MVRSWNGHHHYQHIPDLRYMCLLTTPLLYCLTDIEADLFSGYMYVTEWGSDVRLGIYGTQLVATIPGWDHRWNGPASIPVHPNTLAAYVGATWGSLDQVGTICGLHPVT